MGRDGSAPGGWIWAAAAGAGVCTWLASAGLAAAAAASTTVPAVPSVTIGLGGGGSPSQVSSTVEILLALTVLSLAPAVVLLMTSFTRIVVVLGFARNALGSGSLPPNQVLIGLALFLTLFVMAPTIRQIYGTAWQPYQAGTIGLSAALTRAEAPLAAFMLRQTRTADLQLFEEMQKGSSPAAAAAGGAAGAGVGASSTGQTPLATPAQTAPVPSTPRAASTSPPAVPGAPAAPAAGGSGAGAGGGASASAPPLTVLVPAFVISELRTAFEMGFILFVPFVIIDLVVASTLMAMGMVMLPPMLVSLPFKILLFVLVDGWGLLAQSLVQSFH